MIGTNDASRLLLFNMSSNPQSSNRSKRYLVN